MKISELRLLSYIVLLALSNLCYAGTLPDNPELLWRFKLGSEPSGTPAVSSNIIVTATISGKIAAINSQGKQLWERNLENSSFTAAPMIHGRLAIIGASEGVLYAFDLHDGKTVWTYSTGDLIQSTAVTTALDSVTVIGQPTGRLYCVDTKSGKLKWKSELTNRCDGSPSATKDMIVFGNCDAAIHIFSATSGKQLRSITLGTEGQVAGGVAIKNAHVATGTYGGDVVFADIQTGSIVWTFSEGKGSTHATPFIDTKHVVTVSEAGLVYCLDKESGDAIWQVKLGGSPTSPIINNGRIVISSDGILYILSLDSGKKLWSYEVSDKITTPVLTDTMIIVAGDDGTVSALGAKNEE